MRWKAGYSSRGGRQAWTTLGVFAAFWRTAALLAVAGTAFLLFVILVSLR